MSRVESSRVASVGHSAVDRSSSSEGIEVDERTGTVDLSLEDGSDGATEAIGAPAEASRNTEPGMDGEIPEGFGGG